MAEITLLTRYRDLLARRKEVEGLALLRAEAVVERIVQERRRLEHRQGQLGVPDPDASLAAWFDRVRYHRRLGEQIHALAEEELVTRTRIQELRASLARAWQKEERVTRIIQREEEREARLKTLRSRREEGELIAARHSRHPR